MNMKMTKLNVEKIKEKIYFYLIIILGGLPLFFTSYHYLNAVITNENQFEAPKKYDHLIKKIKSIGIEVKHLNFSQTNNFSLQSALNFKTGSIIEYTNDFNAFLEENNFSIKPEKYSIYYDYFIVLHEIGHYQLNQEKEFWYQGDKQKQELFAFLNQPYSIFPNNHSSYRIFHEAYADAFAYQTFELVFGEDLGSKKEKIFSFIEKLRNQQDSLIYSTKPLSVLKINHGYRNTVEEIHLNSLNIASRILDEKFQIKKRGSSKKNHVRLYFSNQSLLYNEHISETDIRKTWKNACVYWWSQILLGNNPTEIRGWHNPSLRSRDFIDVINSATLQPDKYYARLFQQKWKNEGVVDAKITSGCEKASLDVSPKGSLIDDEIYFIKNKNDLIQNL